MGSSAVNQNVENDSDLPRNSQKSSIISNGGGAGEREGQAKDTKSSPKKLEKRNVERGKSTPVEDKKETPRAEPLPVSSALKNAKEKRRRQTFDISPKIVR